MRLCSQKYLDDLQEAAREEMRAKYKPVIRLANDQLEEMRQILSAWGKTGGLEVAEIRPYQDKKAARG